MNKFIFLSVATMMVAGIASAQEPKPFEIKGQIEGKSDGYIYLNYVGRTSDSVLIENGKFSFNGNLTGPVQATLMIDKKGRSFDKYAQLYLTPGEMKLSVPYGNFTDGIVLKGSSVQDEADKLKKSKEPILAEMKPLREVADKAGQAYREAVQAKKDEATLEALKDASEKAKDALNPYNAQLEKKDEEFMDKYPSSFITASMLRFSVTRMPLKEGDERYNKLSDAIKSSELGKTIKQELDELRAGSPGATAFQFAKKELRGSDLKLTDFRGKYVLVDFWASWCVPCRKGNPHLLSLYAKYKDKGLEIIGVSDDDSNPEAWKKAVDKDKIGVWKHVLRGLKRVDGPEMFDRSESIADKYGISSLPTKVLIDKNGVIIGRYGGGGEGDEEMDAKLKEIFGN